MANLRKNKSLEQLHEILNDSSLAAFEMKQYDALNHSVKDSFFYYKLAVITHMAWIESMDEANLRNNRSLKDIIATCIREYCDAYRGQEKTGYCLVEGDIEKLTKALHNATERIEPVFNKLTRLYAAYSPAIGAPIPETSFEEYSHQEFSKRSLENAEQFEHLRTEHNPPETSEGKSCDPNFADLAEDTYNMIQNVKRKPEAPEEVLHSEQRIDIEYLRSVVLEASRIELKSPNDSPQKQNPIDHEQGIQDTSHLLKHTSSQLVEALQQQIGNLLTKEELEGAIMPLSEKIDQMILEMRSRPNHFDYNSNLNTGVKPDQAKEFMGSAIPYTKEFDPRDEAERDVEKRPLSQANPDSVPAGAMQKRSDVTGYSCNDPTHLIATFPRDQLNTLAGWLYETEKPKMEHEKMKPASKPDEQRKSANDLPQSQTKLVSEEPQKVKPKYYGDPQTIDKFIDNAREDPDWARKLLSRNTTERIIKLLRLVQDLAKNGYQSSMNCLHLLSQLRKNFSQDKEIGLKQEIKKTNDKFRNQTIINSNDINELIKSLDTGDSNATKMLLEGEGLLNLDEIWERSTGLLKDLEKLIGQVVKEGFAPSIKIVKPKLPSNPPAATSSTVSK